MSTLVHVSSERPQGDSVSQSWVAGCINLAFDWYQCYWKCQHQSKSRRSTCLRVERALIRTSLYCPSWYCWRSQVSRVTILPYPNARTGEQRHMRWNRSSLLVSILHAATMLKAVLPFDYVNTFGQKTSIPRAHFIYPYWALDTPSNIYY